MFFGEYSEGTLPQFDSYKVYNSSVDITCRHWTHPNGF